MRRSRARSFTLVAWICVALASAAQVSRAQAPSADGPSADGPSADGPSAEAKIAMVVVVGAAGETQYGEDFQRWASEWKTLAERADADLTLIGPPVEPTTADSKDDLERLRETLETLARSEVSAIWIVLLGHGTFLNDEAKFNLRGPDLSATALRDWLEPIQQPLVLVNGASASGPFINHLSGAGRVLITATQSGAEDNYARFAGFFTTALGSADADLDHDDEVSLLEAFLGAAGSVKKFYDEQSRLSTEHPLIDDNGDGLGTPASLFDGVHPKQLKDSQHEADGREAARVVLIPATDRLELNELQRQQRDTIERQLDELRSQRTRLSDAEYDQKLEALLLPLAKLYHEAEQRQ